MGDCGWRPVEVCSAPVVAGIRALDVVDDKLCRVLVASEEGPPSQNLLVRPVTGLGMRLTSSVVSTNNTWCEITNSEQHIRITKTFSQFRLCNVFPVLGS